MGQTGPMSLILKIAAAAALIAGGTAMATRLNRSVDGRTSQDSSSSVLLDLKQRIGTAEARLRSLEKTNRVKQARAQRKLIEQLNAQRRALERNADQTSSSKTRAGIHETSGDGSSRKYSKRQVTETLAQQPSGPRMGSDELARLRRRRERGQVLYSDEEDALVVADAAECL